MILWVLLAMMTGAAVLAVLVPLSHERARPEPERGDVSFYEQQLAEIARDEERGLLSVGEGASARVEAGRRLIRAAETAPAAGSHTGEPALRRRRAAAALGLSVVPLVGLAVYGAVGSPQLPGQPLASRLAANDQTLDADTALVRMEARLASAPNDRRGWELIGPLYLRLGRFDDAARAYATLIRLGADDGETLSSYGEALVSAGAGVVLAEARQAFEQARRRDPGSPRASFYLALAAEQDGDVGQARATYESILARAAANAPYRPLVEARLGALGGKPPAVLQGAVPPEVSAMVEGLDQRLAAGGGSEAEWSRLVRSLAVLGRDDEARDRLGKARTALAGDPGALGGLDRLSRDLRLSDRPQP